MPAAANTTATASHKFAGHTSWIYSLAFSPDGLTLASGGWDEWIRLWDLEAGTQQAVLEGHKSEVYCLAFSPDGKTLASGSANNTSVVKLWNVATGDEQTELLGHKNVVHTLGWSPDGRWLASGGYDRTVRIWDVNGNPSAAALQATLGGFNHKLYSVLFAPDGQALHTAQADKVTRSWNRAAWQATGTGTPAKPPGNGTDATKPTVISADPSWVHATAFSPDGRLLACGYGQHQPDRSVVGHVEIREVSNGRVVNNLLGHQNFVHSLAFNRDGSQLLTGGWDGELRTWDVATGQQLTRTSAHDTPILAVAFSPDGQKLASAGYDQLVRTFTL
ncbi:MAG: hypothetical protein CMJ68_21345 [Planctomycetaceae bacterium]|nr:hypothetical protein [Planctomycetaceae bacterium]